MMNNCDCVPTNDGSELRANMVRSGHICEASVGKLRESLGWITGLETPIEELCQKGAAPSTEPSLLDISREVLYLTQTIENLADEILKNVR